MAFPLIPIAIVAGLGALGFTFKTGAQASRSVTKDALMLSGAAVISYGAIKTIQKVTK